MVANEGPDLTKPGETLPEPEATIQEPVVCLPAAHVVHGPFWLRLAYSFEFLIALLVIFTLWSEIGGQGHLDMMPWYTKLACGLTMAICCIRFTAGIVEEQRGWNYRSARWLLGLILVALVMGGITYYYHLHEPQDDQENDNNAATSVTVASPSSALFLIRDRTNR
jgi:uncharacterized membrane protein AbrB (regulator of aidB expression)